jgi:two-component system response regulator FixJ
VANGQIVCVVDDDASVRKSLDALLTSAGLTARVYDAATAFLADGAWTDGCLVADIRMPGMNGIELQQEMKRIGSPLPVIFITGHGDIPLAVRTIRAGAYDFIEKPFDDQVLLDSVRSALESRKHDRYRAEEVRTAHELLALLTPRERDVLEQLVVGRSNKLAAHELAVSPRTIEVHRARIMDKLHARSIADLVKMAMTASLLPLSN